MSDEIEIQGESKRSDAMTALGVLGFINTILFIILYGFGVMGMNQIGSMPADEFNELMEESLDNYKGMIPADEMAMYKEEMIPWLQENGFSLCLALLAFTLIRFFAILQMWRRQKAGLPIYAGSQVLRVAVPILMMGSAAFQPIGALLAGLMTFGWFSQRKHLS